MCFFFQAEDGIRDGRVTGVQTCALPILNSVTLFSLIKSCQNVATVDSRLSASLCLQHGILNRRLKRRCQLWHLARDRKSTRLNSSHPSISYAVFCLKKKKP